VPPFKLPFGKIMNCARKCALTMIAESVKQYFDHIEFCNRIRRYCQDHFSLPTDYRQVAEERRLSTGLTQWLNLGKCMADCLDVGKAIDVRVVVTYRGGWKAWCDYNSRLLEYRFIVRVSVFTVTSLQQPRVKRIYSNTGTVNGGCGRLGFHGCCNCID